jgi:hypothetical protein
MKNQSSNPWKTLSSEKIYENLWISLTEHQVINPGGGSGIYGEVHFKIWLLVLSRWMRKIIPGLLDSIAFP